MVKRFFRDLPYYISKANLSFLLAMLIFPLGEIHTLWASDYSEIDVFLFIEYKIYTQWVVRHITAMLQFSIVSYLSYKHIRADDQMKKLMLAVFLYSIGDIVFYFFDMKTTNYGVLYFILCFCLIFINSNKLHLNRKKGDAPTD